MRTKNNEGNKINNTNEAEHGECICLNEVLLEQETLTPAINERLVRIQSATI